jgi:S-formylglutathione hydrolase FrmB
VRIAVTDTTLTSGAPAVMAFDSAKADNWGGGNETSSTSFSFQAQYDHSDANGVAYYNFTSVDNSGASVMRVLAPTNPAPGVPHSFLFVLPVEAGTQTVYGDGLETLRSLDAQDQYNLTIIEPSFGIEPWYADNPGDAGVQYETFMTNDLLPWVEQNLALTGHEQTWLLGFSKSGIGGEDLILKHPDLFTLDASWDFPADMSTYSQYGASSANDYGTDANFQANYRLTSSFVAAHKAPFTAANRLWIGGYQSFAQDVSDYDTLLSSQGVLHSTEIPQLMAHRWDSGWVPIALAALRQESAALP